jgi:hypothetical protein
MYFKHQNGSYKRVPIYPNANLGMQPYHESKETPRKTKLMYTGYQGHNDFTIKGGMTIYYTQKDFANSDLKNHVTAFPTVRHILLGLYVSMTDWT